MTGGTALSDGRFIYQNKNGNLFIEKRGNNGGSTFSLLFGGNAVTFALEESRGYVALLLRNDSQDVQLCVYAFDGNELTEQLCENGGKKVHPKANTLLWVEGGQYVAVSDFHTGTVLYAWDGRKMTKCNGPALSVMEQNGSIPFSTLHYLGVLEPETHTVHFYDTQKEKVVESYCVPNRRGRQNVLRTVCSSTADKNFVFIGNDDATLHSVYVTKGSVRKLTPMQLEFAPSRQRHGNQSSNMNAAGESGSVTEEEGSVVTDTPVIETNPSAKPPIVLCTALSSGQVLVGLDQPPPTAVESSPKALNQCLVVIRYKYIKRLATLVMVEMAKIRLPPSSRGSAAAAAAASQSGSSSIAGSNPCSASGSGASTSAPNEVTLVAISTDGRALVRTLVKCTGEEIYRIETLSFEAMPAPKLPAAADGTVGSNTAANGAPTTATTTTTTNNTKSRAGQSDEQHKATSRQAQKAARGGSVSGAENSHPTPRGSPSASSTNDAKSASILLSFMAGAAAGLSLGIIIGSKSRKA